MRRLLSTLAVALAFGFAPGAWAAFTEISDTTNLPGDQVEVYEHTWSSSLTGTSVDTSSCKLTEWRFDPSTGDTSRDATFKLYGCNGSTFAAADCLELGTPPDTSEALWQPAQHARRYTVLVPQVATSGGDTASFRLRCTKPTTVNSSAVGSSAADPCAGNSSCIVLDDVNEDGNWKDDWRAALNALLYPSGTLSTAEYVDLYAPPPGEYLLTAAAAENGPLVRACYDSSPPAGGSSALMDCTGSSASLRTPILRLKGDWTGVTWHCDYPAGSWTTPTGVQLADCFRLGDVSSDGYIASGVQRLDAPFSVSVKTSVGIAFGSGVFLVAVPVRCDGCSGSFGVRALEGTYASFETSRGAILTGAGDVGEKFNVYLDQPDTANDYPQHLFTGDLRNVSVYGRAVLPLSVGSVNGGANTDGDCTYGTAYTLDTCRGITFEQAFVSLASMVLRGSDIRFRGTIVGNSGVFFQARPTCAENFFGANVFEGRVSCNAAQTYCVRNSNPANCLNPNPGVFNGYSEQLATDNPDRNSAFLALAGRTVLGPAIGYSASSSTANWLASCHTSVGYVEASWSDRFDLELNSYSGPPGAPGTCLKKDGTGLATCGTDATKVYPGVRGVFQGLQVWPAVAVPGATHCIVEPLLNGNAVNANATSEGCNDPSTLRDVSWGGSKAYVVSEAARPVRALGDRVELPILDRLAPTDYVEVRLSNGTATACANGSSCNCNAVDGLRARLLWFRDPQGN